ncbi:MAG: histidine phosphatase family protein [Desulfobacteraceae bacterium]|jgi:probable phosphoglycerate mutase
MFSALTARGSGTSSGGTIYLLRHGAIQFPKDCKRYIGWHNPPLNSIGFRQAVAWADYFSGLGLEEICCSDLIRCRVTAGIISARFSIESRAYPELREVSLGAWEGKSFEYVQTLQPQEFQMRGENLADHRPPGGESFRDLQNRAWPLFETVVRRLRKRTLIVTHAGVIRVLLCRLLGMPLERLFSIGQSYGALTIIDVHPKGCRIQGVNLQQPQKAPSAGRLTVLS